MREGNTIRGIVIAGLLLVIMVSGAAAQPMMTSTPSSITLYQVNPFVVFFLNFSGSWTVEKHLYLDATDNITFLSSGPIDMSQDEEEGPYSLPPGSVSAPVTGINLADIQSNGTTIVPVIFQLGRKTQSGTYKGNAHFSFKDDTDGKGSLNVEVTLKMKDNPLLPLGILIVSSFLGVGFFVYRERDRPFDVFRVRFETFQDDMKRNDNFQKNLPEGIYFKKKIFQHIHAISLALAEADLDTAQSELTLAKGVWGEWLAEERGDLLLLLKKQEKMKNDIPGLKPPIEAVLGKDFLFLDDLAVNLNKFRQDLFIPNESAAFQLALESFRDNMQSAEENLLSFQRTVERARRTEEYCRSQTPPPDKCLETVLACKKKLRDVKNGKVSITECTKLSDYLPFPLKEPETKVPVEEPSRERWLGVDLSLSFAFRRIRDESIGPATKLKWFSRIVFVGLVGVLVIAGFMALYETKSTFGTVTDYVGILLWGFGAGTSSEALTTVLTDAVVKKDVPFLR